MAKTTTYLNNLTALRGIAALLTVVYHVDMWIGNGGGMLVNFDHTKLIERLYLMVDFFFVLSGFIMCYVYGKDFADGVTGAKFRRFIGARLARVYPLHVFTLCLMALIFWGCTKAGLPDFPALTAENSVYSFVTNLLLLHSMNLHSWFTWVHASWSISTEWWMYMIFPFLAAPFFRLSTLGQWVVALLCWGGYFAIMYWILPIVKVPETIPFVKIDPAKMSINVSYQYGFLRCLLGFVWGMVAYRTYTEDRGKALLGNDWVLLLLTIGMFLSFHWGLPDAVSVAFFPFILLSASFGSTGANRFFNWRPLQKLGDWSFSIYLVHQPLILVLFSLALVFAPPAAAEAGPPPKPDMLAGWTICMVVVALTLAISALVYRFWEVPMRRRINKMMAAHT
jgi:peptidoglycan/LPS O-acetylase OafA/YrhL